MTELLKLLMTGDPVTNLIVAALALFLLAPWAFILTWRLVPRAALVRADRDRDRAIAAAERALEARSVDSERLENMERTLAVVVKFIEALPPPRRPRDGGTGGRRAA